MPSPKLSFAKDRASKYATGTFARENGGVDFVHSGKNAPGGRVPLARDIPGPLVPKVGL